MDQLLAGFDWVTRINYFAGERQLLLPVIGQVAVRRALDVVVVAPLRPRSEAPVLVVSVMFQAASRPT